MEYPPLSSPPRRRGRKGGGGDPFLLPPSFLPEIGICLLPFSSSVPSLTRGKRKRKGRRKVPPYFSSSLPSSSLNNSSPPSHPHPTFFFPFLFPSDVPRRRRTSVVGFGSSWAAGRGHPIRPLPRRPLPWRELRETDSRISPGVSIVARTTVPLSPLFRPPTSSPQFLFPHSLHSSSLSFHNLSMEIPPPYPLGLPSTSFPPEIAQQLSPPREGSLLAA